MRSAALPLQSAEGLRRVDQALGRAEGSGRAQQGAAGRSRARKSVALPWTNTTSSQSVIKTGEQSNDAHLTALSRQQKETTTQQHQTHCRLHRQTWMEVMDAAGASAARLSRCAPALGRGTERAWKRLRKGGSRVCPGYGGTGTCASASASASAYTRTKRQTPTKTVRMPRKTSALGRPRPAFEL